MNVVGFADGDWALDLGERRTTSGKCIFTGGKLVSWSSKKQATLSRLSMKAERPTLSNINLDIPIGSLIAVVGSTGEGKTSLVSAMLGELPPIADATVTIRGKVAYVPQVSWIFNTTVRDNILFGMSFEQAKMRSQLT